jgi:hypothetical protein
MPAFFLGVAAVTLVAAAVGGRLDLGMVTARILVMCSIALAVLGPAGRRSRTRARRPGPRSSHAGLGILAAVLVVASLGAFVGSLAAGGTGYPYFWVVVILAVGYVVSVAVRRRRG